MSRHNAQLRAAASAYENAEPPEDELCEETWAEAVHYVATAQAKGGCMAVELLADPYAELSLYAVLHGKPLPFGAAYMRDLHEAAKATQEAVTSRYNDLMASRGRP